GACREPLPRGSRRDVRRLLADAHRRRAVLECRADPEGTGELNTLLLLAQVVRLPFDSLPVVARIPVPARPDWLAIGFGSVWVVDYRPPSLVRIDPATNQVAASIPLSGKACLGIAVTDTALWVADCEHHVVAQIDPAKNAVSRTLTVDFKVDDE